MKTLVSPAICRTGKNHLMGDHSRSRAGKFIAFWSELVKSDTNGPKVKGQPLLMEEGEERTSDYDFACFLENLVMTYA